MTLAADPKLRAVPNVNEPIVTGELSHCAHEGCGRLIYRRPGQQWYHAHSGSTTCG